MVPAEFIRLARAQYLHRRTRNRVPSKRAPYQTAWADLGSGLYGEAWAHADYPHMCLKISGPEGWGANDVRGCIREDEDVPRADAWPMFARHCMQNPHPNLPRIMHFEQPSQRFAWAIMPRYESLAYGIDAERPPMGGETWERIPVEVLKWRQYLEGAVHEGPEWLWPIRGMTGSPNFIVDMHSGNIMYDPSTGEFIITDPFSTNGDGSY